MQEKILFPSLARLSDFLVLSVRNESADTPTYLPVPNTAQIWLKQDGDDFVFFTYDITGKEKRLIHHHDNLSVLSRFGTMGGV